MKRMLTPLAALLLCGSTVLAGKSANCCTPVSANCAPAACNQTTQWYKAKDGTLREMVPYWTALGRAEDADDLEIKLRGTEADLVAAKAETERANAAAAVQKAEFDQRIAELTKQLESERQSVASQTKRAEQAETALAASEAMVVTVRKAQEKSDEQLTSVTAERDGLKTANTDLQKNVTDLTAARDAAEAAANVVQAKLTKITQDAAENKKPEVQSEGDENADGNAPKP